MLEYVSINYKVHAWILHPSHVKRCSRHLAITQLIVGMQSNIVVHAYKITCTTSFVQPSHFTRAINKLRAIKDDLSPSHLEQSINTQRSQNPQTTAWNLPFSPSHYKKVPIYHGQKSWLNCRFSWLMSLKPRFAYRGLSIVMDLPTIVFRLPC
jgi:hypothetical protein